LQFEQKSQYEKSEAFQKMTEHVPIKLLLHY